MLASSSRLATASQADRPKPVYNPNAATAIAVTAPASEVEISSYQIRWAVFVCENLTRFAPESREADQVSGLGCCLDRRHQ
jgi:hypothetical protein